MKNAVTNILEPREIRRIFSGRIRVVKGHNLMPLKGVTGSRATTRGGDPDGSIGGTQ
jgi:hypothetical protein